MRICNPAMDSPEFTKKNDFPSHSSNLNTEEDDQDIDASLHMNIVSTEDSSHQLEFTTVPNSIRRGDSGGVRFNANTKPASPSISDHEDSRASSTVGNIGNKSVSFAGDTMFDGSMKDISEPGRGGQSRVAMLKARLNSSFSKTGGSNDDSFEMSWGGALVLDDVSSSSEDSDDEDDSDDDDDDDGMDKSLRVGDLGGSSKDMDDSSASFRERGMQSFNASFMQIGVSEDLLKGRARTRGSIFLIDDDKFAQTKVVQSRQRKAAVVMQRFLRRCLVVLRMYNEERNYFENELKDIESRRLDELQRYKVYIEEEKQHIKLELEQEYDPIKMTPEEWEEFKSEEKQMKDEIQQLKEENEQMRVEIKELERQNKQLAIRDPIQEQERFYKEQEVKELQRENRRWTTSVNAFKAAVQEAETKIEILTERRKQKRVERKKYAECVTKIVELMGEKQNTDNPSLVKKVAKLSKKRGKKMKKLKAKTISEAQLRKHGVSPKPLEAFKEEHEEHEEHEKETSPGSAIEDMIPIDRDAQAVVLQGEAKSKKDKKKDKKSSKKTKMEGSKSNLEDSSDGLALDKKKDKKSKKSKSEGAATSREKVDSEGAWEKILGEPQLPKPSNATAPISPVQEADKKKKKDKDKKSPKTKKENSDAEKKTEESTPEPKGDSEVSEATALFSLISGK